ncbi:MAG: rhodanese-like domain-containing protein [Deltaproteobacteria bacterium]|nr:rhodanese-like domain-containing protein [Deltaproteobacteria bacterium]
MSVLFGTRWFSARPTEDAARLEAVDEMYEVYRRAFAAVPEVRAEELKQRLEEGQRVVLVDVRGAEERAVSMLPGALSVEEYEAAAAPGDAVVVYCTIGARSGNYALELMERGVDVENLVGSVLAWTHVGGELVGEGGATKRVHVYGAQWDLAANGYEAVW